ncbi:uncharacterized protein LOC134730286 [Pan paniscus]|uniref:uncharacterized protein LOC134730286 n=1 Tax=Pan paniscus TaxID=9597 RepID=UPI00300651F9
MRSQSGWGSGQPNSRPRLRSSQTPTKNSCAAWTSSFSPYTQPSAKPQSRRLSLAAGGGHEPGKGGNSPLGRRAKRDNEVRKVLIVSPLRRYDLEQIPGSFINKAYEVPAVYQMRKRRFMAISG